MRISDNTLNRLAVLKAIRREGPIARSDLPGVTGLSGGTITQLTSDLLRRGLIRERRETARRNGRPRTYLEIDAEGAIVIGASITSVGTLTASFVNLAGELLYCCELPIGTHLTLASMADALAERLAQAIASSPFAPTGISRVGLSISGIVDSGKGNVHYMTTFPVGAPVPFSAPISARLGLPVTIENDLGCMARAEHWFGRATDLDSFTLIDVGFTVSSSEYAEGVPKAGSNGLNSEIGHIKIETGPDARTCYCGGRGCLTAYTSIYGMLDAAEPLDELPFPSLSRMREQFDRYLDAAEAGDCAARNALERAGFHLGVAIANLITASDPGNVLVAVADARFLEAIKGSFHIALRGNVMPGVLPSTNVTLMLSDEDWRWKGTAALALEQTYLGRTAAAPYALDSSVARLKA